MKTGKQSDAVNAAFEAGLEPVEVDTTGLAAAPIDDTAETAETAGEHSSFGDGDLSGQPGFSDDPGPPDPPISSYDDPVDPISKAAQQPLNDYGNGQRFCIHFGDDLMFVPRVGWFTWNGQVWEKDADELKIRRMAQKMGPLIEEELDWVTPTKREAALLDERQVLLDEEAGLQLIPADLRSPEDKQSLSFIGGRLKQIDAALKGYSSRIGRLLTHAKNAGNNGPLGHMMTEAQPDLATELEELDADPLMVNTKSGVLKFEVFDTFRDEGCSDLQVDMQILPHSRGHFITKIMPGHYVENARPEMFLTFLRRIMPEKEMRDFLQRWFGLCMTALKSRSFLFFYGDGANGKSVLVDIMARVFGDYAGSCKVESLTGTNRRGGGDATPDLMLLMSKRFIRTSEPEQGTKMQEGLIKELTGGEPFMARALHSDFIEFAPVFKLVMSGNHKPDIRGTDDGIWDRICLVPFDVRIPPEERDRDLVDKIIAAERDAILSWCVDGLVEYLESGLRPPDKVTSATDEYREESDPYGAFLTQCTVVTGDHEDKVWSSAMTEAFRFWQIDNGTGTFQPQTVSRAIAHKAGRWTHPTTGQKFERRKRSRWAFYGIRFTETFKKRFDLAPRDQRGQVLGPVADEFDGSDIDGG